MATEYSAREARAKLAEILRRVRAGGSVTITCRGTPVAEVRGTGQPPASLAARIESLSGEGRIVRRRGPSKLRPLARCPGGLARFLATRGCAPGQVEPLTALDGTLHYAQGDSFQLRSDE